MRLRSSAAVLGLAVVLAACGGDEGTGTEQPPAPRQVDEATLRAALLVEADLPAGYQSAPEGPDEDDDAEFCDWSPSVEATGDASASFQASEAGPFIDHEIEAYATGQGRALLDEFLVVLNDCASWDTELEGQPVTFQIEALEHTPLGDQSTAFRASADLGGFPVNVEAIVFRRGDVVSSIVVFGLGPVDAALAASLAQAALVKLDATLA